LTDRRLRIGIALLAAAGAGIAAYLLTAHGSPVCSTGGCERVQSSRYAHVIGIPVATLGLVAYLTLLASALSQAPIARAVGAGVALAGLVFSAYLLTVQLAVIGAVCEWCVASEAITLLLTPPAVARVVQ
jgi:uncharacterized membrane protein